MYRIETSNPSRKDFKKLSPEVRKEYPSHLKNLSLNPCCGELLHGLLKGIWKYEFKFKGTDYRIAYRILEREKVILVIMVGSREGFYERLERRVK